MCRCTDCHVVSVFRIDLICTTAWPLSVCRSLCLYVSVCLSAHLSTGAVAVFLVERVGVGAVGLLRMSVCLSTSPLAPLPASFTMQVLALLTCSGLMQH